MRLKFWSKRIRVAPELEVYVNRRYQDLAFCIHVDIANNRGLHNYYAPWLDCTMDKHDLPDHVKWKNSLVLTDSEGRHIGCSGAVQNTLNYYNPLEYNTEEIYKSKVVHLQRKVRPREVRPKKNMFLSSGMPRSRPDHFQESNSENSKSKDGLADEVQIVCEAEFTNTNDCKVDPTQTDLSAIRIQNETIISETNIHKAPASLECESSTHVTGFNSVGEQNAVGTFPVTCTETDLAKTRENNMQQKSATTKQYFLDTDVSDDHRKCGNDNHSFMVEVKTCETKSQNLSKCGDHDKFIAETVEEEGKQKDSLHRSRFCVVL